MALDGLGQGGGPLEGICWCSHFMFTTNTALAFLRPDDLGPWLITPLTLVGQSSAFCLAHALVTGLHLTPASRPEYDPLGKCLHMGGGMQQTVV